MTPLVDVALVLLIIFMVATPMILEGSVKVKLPSAVTAKELPEMALTISVTADGRVEVNGKTVEPEHLVKEIRTQLQKKDQPVVIRGDEAVPYGVVANVLDAARQAGATRLALATRQ